MWFKTRYVKSLEKRIAQFELERLQLIEENKKLIDRLLAAHGFAPVNQREKTTSEAIREAEKIAEAAMGMFEDLEQPTEETNKLERYDGG